MKMRKTAPPLENGGILKWSNDYRQWRLMEDRREINEKHIQENIIPSMKRYGYLAVYPILVTEDGTLWDGNHRLKAAEILNIDYCYAVVEPVDGLDQAILLADSARPWTGADYLHRYVIQGVPSYIAIKDFLDERPYISLSHASQMAFRGDAFQMRRLWKAGKYIANDLKFANEVCDVAEYCAEYGASCALKATFIKALHNVMSNEDFDLEIFMTRVPQQAYKMTGRASVDEYIDVINEVYNYRTYAKNRMYFYRINVTNPKHRNYTSPPQMRNNSFMSSKEDNNE